MVLWVSCLALLPHLSACATSSAPSVSSGGRQLTAIREDFDPVTLNDDDFLIVPGEGRKEVVETVVPPDLVTDRPQHMVTGFRVQIAAVLDKSRAETIRDAAQQQLKQLIYVIYDPETLLYKVHVGNFRSADDAGSLRIDARSSGYAEAFVVRTKVEDASPQVRRTVVQGYRVQIYSASTRETAERAQQRAKDLFVRDDIYVEFEPPFFKVRIGNFATRELAEKFVSIARQHGYETSFSASTQIQVSPR